MTLEPHALLIHLRTSGVLLALLAVMNLFVPRRFRWREELQQVSLLNRQIFQVHGFFIVLILALTAALLLTSSPALLEPSRLSRAVLIGLSIFWALRMVMQWCFYSPETWRGNTFNTAMHYLFSTMWVYLTVTFSTALWFNLKME
jgi:hypothetical protein